jgi:hypothetical protein
MPPHAFRMGLRVIALSACVMMAGVPAASAAEVSPVTMLPSDVFLDRLMQAESGGNAEARNPRSTAVGPFQFIEATFLEVTRRHFPDEIAGLSEAEILSMRTNPAFARRAALAYTADNAARLQEDGHAATSVNLRLAFLLGAAGAIRVLRAEADTPVAKLFGNEVLTANPFMAQMTAADLIRRAVYDLSDNRLVAGLPRARSAEPAIRIRCKLGLASCRRWVALQRAKLARAVKLERRASQ